MFAVMKHYDIMIGVDMHICWPPGEPKPIGPRPYLTIMWLHGIQPLTPLMARTCLTLYGMTMQRGTDIGPGIPHIGPPSILTPLDVLFSCSISYFGPASYCSEILPVAAALAGVVNFNVNCCFVGLLPTGIVICPTTHFTGMTLFDILFGFISYGIDLAFELAIEAIGNQIQKHAVAPIKGRLAAKFASKAAGKVAAESASSAGKAAGKTRPMLGGHRPGGFTPGTPPTGPRPPGPQLGGHRPQPWTPGVTPGGVPAGPQLGGHRPGGFTPGTTPTGPRPPGPQLGGHRPQPWTPGVQPGRVPAGPQLGGHRPQPWTPGGAPGGVPAGLQLGGHRPPGVPGVPPAGGHGPSWMPGVPPAGGHRPPGVPDVPGAPGGGWVPGRPPEHVWKPGKPDPNMRPPGTGPKIGDHRLPESPPSLWEIYLDAGIDAVIELLLEVPMSIPQQYVYDLLALTGIEEWGAPMDTKQMG